MFECSNVCMFLNDVHMYVHNVERYSSVLRNRTFQLIHLESYNNYFWERRNSSNDQGALIHSNCSDQLIPSQVPQTCSINTAKNITWELPISNRSEFNPNWSLSSGAAEDLAVTLPRSKDLSSSCDRWPSGCELIKVVCCRRVARTITTLAAFRWNCWSRFLISFNWNWWNILGWISLTILARLN